MVTPSTDTLSRSEGRRFAFSVGAAFQLLGGLLWWRGVELGPWLLAPGTALWIAGTLAPTRLTLTYRLWMAMAAALSKITTPIVMGGIFLMVLTPTGLIRRWFGSNPLVHFADGSNGYWKSRGDHSRSDLERQF